MQVPSTFVLSISTHDAMLPSKSDASLRLRPALLTSTSMPASGQRLDTILGSVATWRGRNAASDACFGKLW